MILTEVTYNSTNIERTFERVLLIKFFLLNNREPFKLAQVKASLFQDLPGDLMTRKERALIHRSERAVATNWGSGIRHTELSSSTYWICY